jgi:serine protease
VRPVCRFYGTPGIGPNSHFYTVDADECAAVQRDPGWTLEATDVFFAYPPGDGDCSDGRRPVLRAYNNRYALNDSNHRYATDAAAYAEILARGWSPEGVVLCAEP